MEIELTKTFIRSCLVVLVFIAIVTIQGVTDQRQAHQIVFMLGMMGLFSLIIRNVWVTAFMLWTIFLFAFFKFQGQLYLTNIFFGCVLYFITKISFKKEHIDFYLNALLWLVFINLAYMVVQACGFDFIYQKKLPYVVPATYVSNTDLDGFMGHRSIIGSLLAMTIPILASRDSWTAKVGAVGLLTVLWFCNTSLSFLTGIFGLVFVAFYNIPKGLWVVLTILLVSLGVLYNCTVKRLGTERFVMWKQVMTDYIIHPVTGWGLDSFGNVTIQKNFRYAQSVFNHNNGADEKQKVTDVGWWDNPHNLLISILYEFGFIGAFIFFGYLRQVFLGYAKAVKDKNTIALCGFVIAFLALSLGHFPLFLAREAVYIIPCFALLEVACA